MSEKAIMDNMRPIVAEPSISLDSVAAIRKRRPDLPITHPDEPSSVLDALASADKPVAFLCKNSTWRNNYLRELSKGDWIVTKTTGYENYPIDAFHEKRVLFSNIPGLAVDPIAEHVFAMVFSITRRLRTYYDQQNRHIWQRRPDGMTDLVGDICCIVGLGRIGEAVAKRGRAFGMEIRGVKRSVKGYNGAAHSVFSANELHNALEGAHIVVLSVPLTEQTHGMINSGELDICDNAAIVVNVARGPVVDTPALIKALENGKIRAACIDVVDERPPPDDWPLWIRNDVVVTPHVAGSTDKTPERLIDILLSEYDRWIAGELPRHVVVDPDEHD